MLSHMSIEYHNDIKKQKVPNFIQTDPTRFLTEVRVKFGCENSRERGYVYSHGG